ncbi:MAG: hypothetical protein DRO23_02605 [Thermoprotei archaeon]|nr:MAG: hypothetical protein DRO23_02605 [Thermoprotei archaeon]
MRLTAKNEILFKEEELVNFLIKLCKELRNKGMPLSISEVENAMKILKTYCSLTGYIKEKEQYMVPFNDFKEVLKAVLAKRVNYESVFEEVLNNFVLKKASLRYKIVRDIEFNLKELRLHYGDRIPVAKVKVLVKNPSKKQAFYTLWKLGVIKKDSRKGVFEIARKEKINSIVSKCVEHNLKDLNKAANYIMLKNIQKCSLRRIKDEKDFYLDSIEDIIRNKLSIEDLPNTKILELSLYAFEKKRRNVSKFLAKILAHRILKAPSEVKTLDSSKLIKVLKEHDLLDSQIIASILNYNPKAVNELIKDYRNTLLETLSSIRLESQRLVISKLFKSPLSKNEIHKIISTANPRALSSLEKIKYNNLNASEQILIKAASKLAKAFEYYRKAFLENNKGYYDMANSVLEEYHNLMKQYSSTIPVHKMSELEKIVTEKIDVLNALLASVSSGMSSNLPYILKIYGAGFQTLHLLKEVYEAAVDDEVKKNILHAASMVVQRLKTKYRSCITTAKRKKTKRKTANMVIRDSIYNVLRFEEKPIVYQERKKEVKVILLVDVSGSMREFAEHAILIASTFTKSISDLIVFREYVVKVPNRILKNPILLVEFLFNLKFGGWTNIALALSEASRRKGRKVVVMISDLKQTVKGYNPLDEAKYAVKGSIEFIVLTPPLHDEAFANELKTLGAKVYAVNNVEDFVRKLAYIFRSS